MKTRPHKVIVSPFTEQLTLTFSEEKAPMTEAQEEFLTAQLGFCEAVMSKERCIEAMDLMADACRVFNARFPDEYL